jgi:hypothetical protein
MARHRRLEGARHLAQIPVSPEIAYLGCEMGCEMARIANVGPCDRYARFPTGPVEQRHGSTSIRELGYPSHLAAKVRDLWAHRDLGEMTGSFQATVPSHGVVMVTIKP